MRPEREDLPVTGPEGESDLTPEFTYEEMMEELWGEIDSKLPKNQYPAMEKGDITKNAWAEHHNTSQNGALYQMRAFVKNNPGWKILNVWSSEKGGAVTVLRKEK